MYWLGILLSALRNFPSPAASVEATSNAMTIVANRFMRLSFPKKRAGRTARPSSCEREALVDVQRRVVDDERGLQRAVLGRVETDADGLTSVCEKVERLQHVAGVLVQVRVRGQGRIRRAAVVADLDAEGVPRGRVAGTL